MKGSIKAVTYKWLMTSGKAIVLSIYLFLNFFLF